MMRLSRLTDYAVVVLSQMTADGPGVSTAVGIAEATSLPQPTVAKVLKLLARHGVVESRRGTQGGYVLERAPKDISVAEIITAIDGPVALTACVDDAEGSCTVESLCPLRGRWDKLNTAVQGAFESVSLAEILAVPTIPNFIDPPPSADGLDPVRTGSV